MDKGYVIQTLRAYEPELKAAGIVHLRLFGSVARDESSPESDVDLMADFDGSKRFSLVTMAHLENRLTDILGIKVDLTPADSMKEDIRRQAVREAVLAF
jgi:uncharacterized protein